MQLCPWLLVPGRWGPWSEQCGLRSVDPRSEKPGPAGRLRGPQAGLWKRVTCPVLPVLLSCPQEMVDLFCQMHSQVSRGGKCDLLGLHQMREALWILLILSGETLTEVSGCAALLSPRSQGGDLALRIFTGSREETRPVGKGSRPRSAGNQGEEPG